MYDLHSAIYICNSIASVKCGTEVENKCGKK